MRGLMTAYSHGDGRCLRYAPRFLFLPWHSSYTRLISYYPPQYINIWIYVHLKYTKNVLPLQDTMPSPRIPKKTEASFPALERRGLELLGESIARRLSTGTIMCTTERVVVCLPGAAFPPSSVILERGRLA